MFDKQLKQKRTKCVIYCRVSSIKQTMDGAGLSSQERSCRDYAQQCCMQVEDVFTDVISGASSNRPGMNQLLDFLNRVDARDYMVIVDDVSRFARDVGAHCHFMAVATRPLRDIGPKLIKIALLQGLEFVGNAVQFRVLRRVFL